MKVLDLEARIPLLLVCEGSHEASAAPIMSLQYFASFFGFSFSVVFASLSVV